MKKIYEIIISALLTTIDHDDYYYMDHAEEVAWELCSIYTRNAFQPSEDAYNYLDESLIFDLRALKTIDSDINELLT